MNYLQILIEGYGKESTRKILDKYFIRKYKEAKDNHYSYDEFFTGCLEVIHSFYSEMDRRVFERQRELYTIINWKKNGMNGSNDTPKEPSKEDLQVVDNLELELKEMGRRNFPVSLHGISRGVYHGNLWENDVICIEKSLKAAMDLESITNAKITKEFRITEFSEFFEESVSKKLIVEIQKEFNGYINKDMAILIYLLDKEHKLIAIHNQSKGKSRKSFVESLTKKQYKSIQSINKYFEATTEVLKTIGATDSSYIQIKKKLDKIVCSC